MGQPTVLDLFCGAGGFSLGFQQAGYDVLAGVDADETAVETYQQNHDADGYVRDLTATTPEDLADDIGVQPSAVDVVVGGPPCQGFSTANTKRTVDDARNNLVFVFRDYVAYYEPSVFLMENVTGITSVDDGSLFTRLLREFREAGYTVDNRVLNAADYGVPQTRKRMFVQGVREGTPSWPERTHAPRDESHQQKLTAVSND